MKSTNFLLMATFSPLFACSTVAEVYRPPLQVFTGRLEFAGEFHLFTFPTSSSRSKECMSGVFPLQSHLRAKRLYRGKLVRITGRMVAYSSLVEQVGTELGWKGSQVPNYCGGNYIILAEKAEVIKSDVIQ